MVGNILFSTALAIGALVGVSLVLTPQTNSLSNFRQEQRTLTTEELSDIRHSIADRNIAEEIPFSGQTFTAYTVEVSVEKLRLYWRDEIGAPLGSPQRLKKYLSEKGESLVFATNAGIFDPNQRPVGLYVEAGKPLVGLNQDQGPSGNFFMQPNGVFFVAAGRPGIETTQDFAKRNSNAKLSLATQSGPMLLIKGTINTAFSKESDNENIRSGVCITDQGKVAFAISNTPVNFYNFANFFKVALKCRDALYLDGAISKMYLPKMLRFEQGGKFAAMFGVALPKNQAVELRTDTRESRGEKSRVIEPKKPAPKAGATEAVHSQPPAANEIGPDEPPKSHLDDQGAPTAAPPAEKPADQPKPSLRARF